MPTPHPFPKKVSMRSRGITYNPSIVETQLESPRLHRAQPGYTRATRAAAMGSPGAQSLEIHPLMISRLSISFIVLNQDTFESELEVMLELFQISRPDGHPGQSARSWLESSEE